MTGNGEEPTTPEPDPPVVAMQQEPPDVEEEEELPVGASTPGEPTMDVAKAERVYLIPDPERCGKPMKYGRTCGRHPDHRNECRSREAMTAEAARKRAVAAA